MGQQAQSSRSASVLGIDSLPGEEGESIDLLLRSVRNHLGMQMAFVTEFRGDHRIFCHVDSDPEFSPVSKGDTLPQEAGYCKRLVEGTLPELIPDTSVVPEALEISETHLVPVGAHIGVPVRLRSGDLYGTLCCLSPTADPTLNGRDLKLLRTFSELIGHQIDLCRERSGFREQKIHTIYEAMGADAPSQVYQPILSLHDSALIGIECLSRFEVDPVRSPEQWFREASEVGLGIEFELHAIRKSLLGLRNLSGSAFISINCSPETILNAGIADALGGFSPNRIVLEITENQQVEDYPALLHALSPLRARGVRIAVDDAGSGYASMRHILAIRPEIIKLDVSLIRDIHLDSGRRALAAAFVTFGQRTGSLLIAEGVEHPRQVKTLLELGVENAQGNFLSRPLTQDQLLEYQDSSLAFTPS